MIFGDQNLSLEKCPALVLNADYRPLGYYPLSLWSWQDSVKSVFLDRVTIVSNYDRIIRSPSFNIKLPSVIALKSFIKPQSNPSFTRFNVFLRDKFLCQYCGSDQELTFDHLLPRSKGGQTNWDNVVTACSSCNVKKGGRLLKNSQICLSGFSQGCMMSINLGLTSSKNYNCIIGFSGKVINSEDLIKRKN